MGSSEASPAQQHVRPLRTLRRLRGWSQLQLAQRVHLSPRTIRGIENREQVPHPDNAYRIAMALGVVPEQIEEFLNGFSQHHPRPPRFRA